MENFVLYNELGRGSFSVVYKGRQKNTIEYVAIKRLKKKYKPRVSKEIAILHDLKNANVLKFYAWYETHSHIWVIEDFITGMSLREILNEDKQLPLETIRQFGIHLVSGLAYLHTKNILYNDFRPSSILVDGNGTLKYSKFGNALEYSAYGEMDFKNIDGCPFYMAPELFFVDGGPSLLSDLWGLGCLLFEMSQGKPPVAKMSFDEFFEGTMEGENGALLERLLMRSSKNVGLVELLRGVLEKNISKRMGWESLRAAAFWEYEFPSKDLSFFAKDEANTRRSQKTYEKSERLHIATETMEYFSRSYILGHKNTDLGDFSNLDSDRIRITLQKNKLPLSSPDINSKSAESEQRVSSTSLNTVSDKASMKSENLLPLLLKGKRENSSLAEEFNRLIFHNSENKVSPIVGNASIYKTPSTQFDPDSLGFKAIAGTDFAKLDSQHIESHLDLVYNGLCLNVTKKVDSKQNNVFKYFCSLCCCTEAANVIINSALFEKLLNCVKISASLDFKGNMALCIGLLVRFTTIIRPAFPMFETISCLSQACSDGFGNGRLKLRTIPTIGELLFYVASQHSLSENRGEQEFEDWKFPSIAVSLVKKCLSKCEDYALRHFAAKIIENISKCDPAFSSKFANPNVIIALFEIFQNVPKECAKTTAITAISRLCYANPSLLEPLFAKYGVTLFKDSLIPKDDSAMINLVNLMNVYVNYFKSDAKAIFEVDNGKIMESLCERLETSSGLNQAKTVLFLGGVTLYKCELIVPFVIKYNFEKILARICINLQESSVKKASSKDYSSSCLDLIGNALVSSSSEYIKEVTESFERLQTWKVSDQKSIQNKLLFVEKCVALSIVRDHVSLQYLQDLSVLVFTTTQAFVTLGSGVLQSLTIVQRILQYLMTSKVMILNNPDVIIEKYLELLLKVVDLEANELAYDFFGLFCECVGTLMGCKDVFDLDATQGPIAGRTAALNSVVIKSFVPKIKGWANRDEILFVGIAKFILNVVRTSGAYASLFMKTKTIGCLLSAVKIDGLAGNSLVLKLLVQLYEADRDNCQYLFRYDVGTFTLECLKFALVNSPLSMLLSVVNLLYYLLSTVMKSVKEALNCPPRKEKRGTKESTALSLSSDSFVEGAAEMMLNRMACFNSNIDILFEILGQSYHQVRRSVEGRLESDILTPGEDQALKGKVALSLYYIFQLYKNAGETFILPENLHSFCLTCNDSNVNELKSLFKVYIRLFSQREDLLEDVVNMENLNPPILFKQTLQHALLSKAHPLNQSTKELVHQLLNLFS
eukprot:Nk52_evm42s359 gene=Nk52_evmTU42s359